METSTDTTTTSERFHVRTPGGRHSRKCWCYHEDRSKAEATTNTDTTIKVSINHPDGRRNGIVAREANPVQTVAIVNGRDEVEIEPGCAHVEALAAVAAAGF